MSFIQKFVKAVFPKRWVEKLERDSHQWKVRCKKCGETNSLWELGGIRGGAAGKAHWGRRCAKCGERSWHEIVHEPDSK